MIIAYEAKRVFHNHSGLGNYGRNIIEGLARQFPENQYRLYNPYPGKIAFAPGPNVEEVLAPYPNKLMGQIWRRSLLGQRAQRDGAAVFHGLSAELPRGLKNVPAVVSMHDLIFMRYPEFYSAIDRRVYRRKTLQAARQAQQIVAVSHQTRQDLIDLLGLADHRIKVIFQTCAAEYWQDHSALGQKLQAQWQLPERFALFVGSLETRKNPVMLAQACVRLKIPLVLVGRPSAYWDRYWQKTSSAERRYLHPLALKETKSLAALYQRASLFAYPSVFEGFGIPILEAMVSGTPVLSFRGSALQEVAGPGSVLIDSLEPEALEAALAMLWHSPESYPERVAKNRNFAQQFHPAVLSQQWMETYRQLAQI